MSEADCLPLIISFGGVNCAGRSSGYHAFRRLVFDRLGEEHQQTTLASLQGLIASSPGNKPAQGEREFDRQALLGGSLVRRLEDDWFTSHGIEPGQLESHAAGSLPCGFDPGALYTSRNHPRGLQMALFAMNDCLGNLGFDWQQIAALVNPDKIGVYASSALGQLDEYALGGLLQSRLDGRRTTTKQIPFSYPQAIADMINAYVLGNLGGTSCSLGACAGFLYNLAQAVRDIREGHVQLAVVGVAEAPLVPELVEGFTRMSALASNDKLAAMQGVDQESIDFSSACRPFSDNCGFVLAESAQFLVLAAPHLTMTLGARIFGAVSDVCVNADGYKQSISSPGVGNYLSVARCAANLRALLGEESLQRSVVHAHGTGTPINRSTESEIFSRVAQAFGIRSWPLTALKGLVGHSQAAAGADQLMLGLGVWANGIIPGITTTNELGEGVATKGLDFCLEHREIDPGSLDAMLINAKGFGGNNATALLLSPQIGESALRQLFGEKGHKNWRKRSEIHAANAANYDRNASNGELSFRYLFNHHVLNGTELRISSDRVGIPGYPDCPLPVQHPLSGLLSGPRTGF